MFQGSTSKPSFRKSSFFKQKLAIQLIDRVYETPSNLSKAKISEGTTEKLRSLKELNAAIVNGGIRDVALARAIVKHVLEHLIHDLNSSGVDDIPNFLRALDLRSFFK